MTAEEIVRRLAAEGPFLSDDPDTNMNCLNCEIMMHALDVDEHRHDCLWRIAVEWVGKQDRLKAMDL